MSSYNVKEEKNRLRETYKNLRKELSDEERRSRSEAICRYFLALNSYRYADTILLYAPLKYEIDNQIILEDALKKGKKIAYPRCIEDNKMVYHYITSKEQLLSGKYGIMEPSSDLPVYNNENDHPICILPALVYDKKGYRLGYGKGYYDRFLSGFRGIKVGLVYSDFIIDTVPKGRFDLPSDLIITEKGVISFAKN